MSAGDKPVIGTSGIKYGLVLPKALPKQPPKVAPANPLFRIDDDNEEEIKDIRKVMLEAQKATSARIAQVRLPFFTLNIHFSSVRSNFASGEWLPFLFNLIGSSHDVFFSTLWQYFGLICLNRFFLLI
jgi:hypothetical protein